ncbi:MAG: hypothetical protein LBT98_01975 [Puniceicoccales bacterium]|jgi:phosphoribosylpyrophosphate synthetase|nr:hypothetical protein [Puniceicoccales bacterium]
MESIALYALGNRHPPSADQLPCRLGRLNLRRFPGGHCSIAAEPLHPASAVLLWATKNFGETPERRLLRSAIAVQALREWHKGPLLLAHPYADYSRANQLPCLRAYGGLLRSLPVDRHIFFDLHGDHYLRHLDLPFLQRPTLSLWADHFRGSGIGLAVSPDLGRHGAVRQLADSLAVASLTLDKTGHCQLSPDQLRLPHGRDVLLFDDEIVGGGTMAGAARELLRLGARSIAMAATYALCRPAVLEMLQGLPGVRSLAVGDLVHHPRPAACAVVPLAQPLLEKIFGQRREASYGQDP